MQFDSVDKTIVFAVEHREVQSHESGIFQLVWVQVGWSEDTRSAAARKGL